MDSSVAAFSSPVVDGYCPIVSDTTALIFISGRDRMPVGRLGLEAGCEAGCGMGGCAVRAGRLGSSSASRIPHPASLLYIATQIKLAPRLRDDAIEAGFYFRGQIFSPEQALGFATNRLQRLDEVAALQFSGIVGHWRR